MWINNDLLILSNCPACVSALPPWMGLLVASPHSGVCVHSARGACGLATHRHTFNAQKWAIQIRYLTPETSLSIAINPILVFWWHFSLTRFEPLWMTLKGESDCEVRFLLTPLFDGPSSRYVPPHFPLVRLQKPRIRRLVANILQARSYALYYRLRVY